MEKRNQTKQKKYCESGSGSKPTDESLTNSAGSDNADGNKNDNDQILKDENVVSKLKSNGLNSRSNQNSLNSQLQEAEIESSWHTGSTVISENEPYVCKQDINIASNQTEANHEIVQAQANIAVPINNQKSDSKETEDSISIVLDSTENLDTDGQVGIRKKKIVRSKPFMENYRVTFKYPIEDIIPKVSNYMSYFELLQAEEREKKISYRIRTWVRTKVTVFTGYSRRLKNWFNINASQNSSQTHLDTSNSDSSSEVNKQKGAELKLGKSHSASIIYKSTSSMEVTPVPSVQSQEIILPDRSTNSKIRPAKKSSFTSFMPCWNKRCTNKTAQEVAATSGSQSYDINVNVVNEPTSRTSTVAAEASI